MGNNSVNERYADWLPKQKTMFPLSKKVTTTFNLGQLTPLGFFEALPADTFNFKANSLIRLISPLVKPSMEQFTVHYTVWGVPLRLLQDDFKKVMGQRDDYDSKTDGEYTIPQMNFTGPDGQEIYNYHSSILAYAGVPLPNDNDKRLGRKLHNVSKLFNNAYALIHNEHYRDQNLQQAKLIDKSNTPLNFIAENDKNADYHNSAPNFYAGKLASVNRDFDYFSNVFTDTQKGEKVVISLAGRAPVVTGTQEYDLSPGAPEMVWNNINTGKKYTPVHGSPQGSYILGTDGTGATTGETVEAFSSEQSYKISPRNLFADLSNISSFGINDLRELEKLQKRKELDLVAGTRYYEIVDNYFGVKNALATLDYPIQLAYSQSTLDISQVVQTSSTGTDAQTTTAQGNVAGYAVSGANNGNVNFTTQEHMLIIPMVYVTQRHTYETGLHKFFNRKSKLDFFDPLQIGNGFQPIKKTEIYGYATDAEKDDVWGFAPNAERYRKETDLVTGMIAKNATGSISQWMAADVYDDRPTFSPQWKLEQPTFLDNILQYGSNIVDQFVLQTGFDGIKISSVDPLGVPFI